MAVSITIDRTQLLKQAMKALKDSAVLVGIPSDSSRNIRTDTPETNAEIGFVNEFGEPSKNIPARPFLMPGVQDAMPKNEKIMLNGAKKALSLNDNPVVAIDNALNLVGLNSQNAVQNYMVNGDFAPLSPRTIAGRAERRVYITEQQRADWESLGVADDQPLIDTGSLKAAITYAVET
jgi:hypothetical protein